MKNSTHVVCIFYGFLFCAFYICISRNLQVGGLWTTNNCQPIECGSDKFEHFSTKSNVDKTKTEIDENDKYQAAGSDALSFYNDLELIKLIGQGDVSYAFEARYKNKKVVAKIAADSDLYYSDLEIDYFHELKASPSISNIPELYYSVRSMPNPFFAGNITYLKKDLGIATKNAKSIITKRRISVMAMDRLEGERDPENMDELRRLMKSLLETMQFVHSRNIMHCDLHGNNYYWDGDKVYFFDWNAAFWYEPNKVPIHYNRAPTHLFPPEAKGNTSAVHTSVYAFDVYTIGRLMKLLLKSCCGVTRERLNKSLPDLASSISSSSSKIKEEWSTLLDEAVAYELAEYMMIPNPYKRPDTTAALKHPFFEKLMAQQ